MPSLNTSAPTQRDYLDKFPLTRLGRELFSMYNEEINEKHCRRCSEQDAKIALKYEGERKRCPPQSFFNIEESLDEHGGSIRLAFVGKTSWNDAEILKDPKIGPVYDCRYMGAARWNDTTPYWTAVRTITEGLKLARANVFITNFAKCNIYKVTNNSFANITDWEYFDACKDILEKEIEIVKPTHVIFLTSDNYDSLIRGFNFRCSPSKLVDAHGTSDCFKKEILVKDESRTRPVCWWYRIYLRDDGTKMHLLRTRHPQGALGHFEEEIVKWVTEAR